MNIFNQFTLRTLKKNKTRTLVTIIGIALSVAMFTAVTSIIVSFQRYLLDVEIATEGAWEARLEYSSGETAAAIVKDKEVKAYTQTADLGYAKLEDCENVDKPYLYVVGIQENYTDFSPVNLVEGRMPQNNSELVIPQHLEDNGGIKYQIGDKLELQLGQRAYAGGEAKGTLIGGQNLDYQSEEPGGEKLVNVIDRTYTVVGICERPVAESYSSPGYTAFTLDSETKAAAYDVFLTFHHPKKSLDIVERYVQGGDAYTTHSALLRYQGNSTNNNYNVVLYSMGAILIGIIMLGSISLIYNAFSISVSERTKQFGLLKSIGATKKQMRRSVLFEACVLSVFGIFLGLLAGLGGIGITLHFVSKLINKLWASYPDAELSLVITWQSVLTAVLIGFITVLVSAMIPARKAVKLSAIQAIRQNNDVRIRPGEVRTSGISYRLFGFEAMLAGKNFKRNRKKYRATVFSLFISIVLFVTSTSFSAYMKASTDVAESKVDYDIGYSIQDETMGKNTAEGIAKGTASVSVVKETGYSRSTSATIDIPVEYLNPEYLEVLEKEQEGVINEKEKTLTQNVEIYYIRDAVYERYLEKAGLDVSQYMDQKDWTALVWNVANVYIDGKIFTADILKQSGWSGEVNLIKGLKGYYYSHQEDGKYIYYSEDPDKEKRLSVQEACRTFQINLGEIQDGKVPLGVNDLRWDAALTLVLPYSAAAQYQLNKEITSMDSVSYQVRTSDHKKAYGEIAEYLSQIGYKNESSVGLYDHAESNESEMALIMIVDIFSYGFIILISLISLANVFNTISTNIQLRRQEFAMLKSVGMTRKGFNRMMNYECLLYGAKGLLYGIPVSILLSWLMYRSVMNGWNATYLFPWQGILIASACVFLVVFSTMLYAMSKVKKDNPIEALRNENL